MIAEVGYLLQTRGGTQIEANFLRSLAEGTLTHIGLEPVDFVRMAELVETYADFPLGTTDAAVIALAERLGIAEIAPWTIGTSPWSARGTSRRSRSFPER